MKKIIIIILLSLLTSCDEKMEANKALPFMKSEIVGGVEATDNFEAVVGIEKDGHIVCSGTLIEKDKIMTAGHCVLNEQNRNFVNAYILYYLKEQKTLKTIEEKRDWIKQTLDKKIEEFAKEIGIYFGNGVEYGAVVGEKIVEVANVDPSYRNLWLLEIYKANGLFKSNEKLPIEEMTSDLATLTLSKNVKNVTPIKLISKSEMIDLLSNVEPDVLALGFGWRKTNIEIKYHSEESKPFYGYRYKTTLTMRGTWKNRIMTGNLENGVCSGDSGGPLLIMGDDYEYRLVAVNSTGKEVCGTLGYKIEKKYYPDVNGTHSAVVDLEYILHESKHK